MKLMHATTLNALEAIVRDGLPARSRWTCDDDVLRCLEQPFVDAGDEPITLIVGLEELRQLGNRHLKPLQPDTQSIYEPFSQAVGLSEQAIEAGWEHSPKDWVASLMLVWSVRVAVPIPASMLSMIVAGRQGEGPRTMPLCVRKRREQSEQAAAVATDLSAGASAWRERATDRPIGKGGRIEPDDACEAGSGSIRFCDPSASHPSRAQAGDTSDACAA